MPNRPQNREEKKKFSLSGFIQNITTSIFRDYQDEGKPINDNAAISEQLFSLLKQNKLQRRKSSFNNQRTNEILSLFDSLASTDTKKIFIDFIRNFEKAYTDESTYHILSEEIDAFENSIKSDRMQLKTAMAGIDEAGMWALARNIEPDTSIPPLLRLEVFYILIKETTKPGHQPGNDRLTATLNEGATKIEWFLTSEKRIIEYIVNALKKFGNAKDRLSCLVKIAPYVLSRVTDEQLSHFCKNIVKCWELCYSAIIKRETSVKIEKQNIMLETLPEFGDEEDDLLERLGEKDKKEEIPDNDTYGAEEHENGSGEKNRGEEFNKIEALSGNSEPAIIKRNGKSIKTVMRDKVKDLETEIDRIESLDEKIVTLRFWITNNYYSNDDTILDFLGKKLESIERLKGLAGGLIEDLFYELRKIDGSEDQLRFLAKQLQSPQYIHIKQTIAAIIDNIKAEINFETGRFSEESVREMINKENDLSKKKNLLVVMKYQKQCEPILGFIEAEIEEIEKIESDTIWEKLEEKYYESTDNNIIESDNSASGDIIHSNIISLVRKIKTIPDKVERKKYIKDQENKKPLDPDDTFQKQRKLLYYLLNADSLEKPEAMLKALTDRVLLSFKDKKEYLEILKKSRFNASGKLVTLQDELGIRDEQIAYYAVSIIGFERGLLEQRIKYIEHFRQGAFQVPPIRYKNKSGDLIETGYREFFGITDAMIRVVIDNLQAMIEVIRKRAAERPVIRNDGEEPFMIHTPDGSITDNKENNPINDDKTSGFEPIEGIKEESFETNDDIGADKEIAETEDRHSESTKKDKNPIPSVNGILKINDADLPAQVKKIGNPTATGKHKTSIDILSRDHNEVAEKKGHTEPIDQAGNSDNADGSDDNDKMLVEPLYQEKKAEIDPKVKSDIIEIGKKKSEHDREPVKRQANDTSEDKTSSGEQKLRSLLMRLSLCFPEAIPELIEKSIIPVFTAKNEYRLRDILSAVDKNIFIPVLYEGIRIDVHQVLKSFESFMHISDLSGECENIIVAIAKRMKHTRGSFIKNRIEKNDKVEKDIGELPEFAETQPHNPAFDKEQNTIGQNGISTDFSDSSINEEPGAKTTSETDITRDTAVLKVEHNKVKSEGILTNKTKDIAAEKKTTQEVPSIKTQETKTEVLKQNPSKTQNQKKPEKKKQASFLSLFTQDKSPAPKKKTVKADDIKSKRIPAKQVKSQSPETNVSRMQHTLIQSAREIMTEKLIYLIREYSNLAMLDMLFKSYLNPRCPKKNLLALIDPKKNKLIYDSLKDDNAMIEKLGYDREKVMSMYEKKKRKLS